MYRTIQRSTRIIVPASLAAAALLGGCTTMQEPTYPPTKGAVLGANPRTVEYPGGRYQLYGEGTTTAPYYWVWIPTGSTPATPPPLPPARVASSSTQGRYQLYGEGTTAAPYYWVWVPAGATVVPPPPPPVTR